MRLTVRTFAVVTLFCAVTCEAPQAALIAPIGGIRTGSSNTSLKFICIIARVTRTTIGIDAMVIALVGGPQAGTIGPLMAQNAGIIGGINKLRSAELLISGSSLQKVWNLRDAAATKRRSSPAFDDLNQVP